MAGNNLTAAAAQAGLTPQQNVQITALQKLLDSNSALMGLPTQTAKTTFSNLSQDQQNAHIAFFGQDDKVVQAKPSAFGNIMHYITLPVVQPIKMVFGALNEVSDFMTRLYRTGAIALDQGVDLAKAFNIADDNGNKVFSPGRIQSAKLKFGSNIVDIAMQVASGIPGEQIYANAPESQKQMVANAIQGKDNLFNDALAIVQSSKYSPGRQLANILLPSSMEGKGLLYKGISGIGDAAYRVFTDPTLALGKAKKAYDAGDFLLMKLLGKQDYSYGRNLMSTMGNSANVDRIFSNPQVTNLFDQYGKQLEILSSARKSISGTGNIKIAEEASQNLRRLIPEFGPEGINQFIVAGVKDAQTTKNFLLNHIDVKSILRGQAARRTPLVPTLNAARKARINFFTTTNKVFNFDKVGQNIVTALYGTAPIYQDIVTGLTQRAEEIAKLEAPVGRLTQGKIRDGSIRLSLNQIRGKIDLFSRKFTTMPYFQNNVFDVMSADAPIQVFRLASIANTRYSSRLISEAFAASDEGARKQIFIGLWNTIAEIRGVTKSIVGKDFIDNFSGKGLDYSYAASRRVEKVDNLGKPILDSQGNKTYDIINPANFNDEQMALYGYQLNSFIAVPSILDLDRLSVRAGIIGKIMGISHKQWADKLTSGWVIGTLAGPKFPVRNAGEDLMIHLAVGDSPWGIAKARVISTRWRQVKAAEASLSKEQIDLGNEISTLVKKTQKLKATDPLKAKNEKLILDKRVTLRELKGDRTKFYNSNLGFINRLVGYKSVKEFQIKLAEAGDDVEAVRKVMGEAILTGKLSSRVMSKESKAYLKEFAEYGNLENTLADIAEGGKNALRGGGQFVSTSNSNKIFGYMRALIINGKKWETSGNGFRDYNPVATTEARIGWMVKIAITTNDELSSILVKELDDKRLAISNLKNYLDSLPKKELNRFQIYSANIGATTQIHAERLYDDVLNTFSKADGTLNKELWNKVRTLDNQGNPVLSSKNLNIDDLPTITDKALHPEFISGPTYVPVSKNNNFGSSVIERLWDYMGEANARFSREPIVIDAMVSIRGDMEATGFAKNFIQQFTAGQTGKALIKAEANAKRELVDIVESLAKERVLAFVDNPAVRSQLAMSARNFARFYRATEDFYRRVYRSVKYNPEALTRASLTYEGVSHSGFVQTDDNGEQYFFYPGLNPVYKVMNKVMTIFGYADAFQVPMPLEFGGKLKMTTPSLNPDSLFPTFSGPLAAFPIKMLGAIVPQVKDLEQYFLGVYGVDQPMISSILPAHVNRVLSLLNKDERNSQYASAYRKAVTYLEATGNGLKIKIDPDTGLEIPPTPGEIAAYQDMVQSSTMTVLAVRFGFSFFAPAAPQISIKSDMAQWVRDNGRSNYKQVFNQLVTKYGDPDKATQEWIRDFPNQMPYTVSESERTVVASVRAVGQAGNWIKQNQALLEKYPEGAAFLIPQAGGFDFNAYKMLTKSGLKVNKTLSDFLRESTTAKDVQTYYTTKDEYDAQLVNTFSDVAKRQLREQWGIWKTQWLGARPLVQEQLGQGSDRKIQKLNAYKDLQRLLSDGSIKTQPKTLETLKQMSKEYNSYMNARDSIFGNTDSAQNYKDLLKSNIKLKLKEIAGTNQSALSAYNILFASLIGE